MLPDKAGLEKKYVRESGGIIHAEERSALVSFSADERLRAGKEGGRGATN